MNRRSVLLGLGLLGPVVACLVLVILVQVSDALVPSAFALVRHTQQVQLALTNALSQAREAETAHRLYLITGDGPARTRYREMADSAPLALAEVRALVSTNPGQLARTDTIAGHLSQRLAALAETAALAGSGRRESAFVIVRSGPGPALMDSVRATTARALAEEGRLLAEHEAVVGVRLNNRRRLGWILLAGSIALVACVLVILRAWRRQRSLVTVCAWSKVIQHEGEWMTFEEYLRLRFQIDVSHGISPEAEQQLMTGEFAVQATASKPPAAA